MASSARAAHGAVSHAVPPKGCSCVAWRITSQKYGANALGLQRDLGLGSYQTAWSWLHEFRRAMVRPGRDRLDGIIEADEAYVGGVEEGATGGHTENRVIVAIAVEVEDEKRLGRLRMRPVPDVSAGSLGPFVRSDAVEPGATVLTDGWSGYTGLPVLGCDRLVINQSASPDPAHMLLPGPLVLPTHRASGLRALHAKRGSLQWYRPGSTAYRMRVTARTTTPWGHFS